ncbi:glycosyl-4,4'-diaponeurosporenoate acyltransferase [Sporosarcina sp. NCCP-2716]|uniref:glycosyl-4,4'-diaponeurosporenoate acyltransferase CrtO family protein n=1 Tax=Sporosarcina sp. NCCP-2716 TaxID=2943679 RepID=UPI00203CD063|nr:glycosyl-4,4'-diaponeurosporenoate acyltransferase [Sporosarcina sp. NCCP-2716]GKV68313.1 glycosyl-4,4'-diaponeurosporenoate acyltransferase [Sporosarcina sp. NCCP-2716]
MTLRNLPIVWVVVLDAAAWTFFHLAISVAMERISHGWFVQHARLFRPLSFEQGGALWDRLFRVRSWKSLIPDGTLFIRSGYSKKALHGSAEEDFARFAAESRRAELTHWLSILPAFLFFLWNPVWAGWLNVAYALLFNVPIILAQRFNRPRLERLLKRKSKRPSAD